MIVHNECFGCHDDKFIENYAAHGGVPAVMLHVQAQLSPGQNGRWRKLLGISSFSHEARD
jgi:hypothetical protein